ncbi:hypothetical protein [Paenibacillus sp. FSL H3-0469]|uniref:hypothetical protein n=1 Tax=Paenibacillus sp. FSL H3-0469 TaxID=2954506 RepID=UPI00310162B6
MKLKFGMKDVFTVLMTISIILLCILAGLRRIYLSDFIPINGDFQSYNGFRRLLSGQIPFKDFYFYLGLGPLYLNSFFLLLFGDNFTHSLFVTNSVTAFVFSIAIFSILKLNRISRNSALVVTFTLLAFGLGFRDFLNIHLFFEKINLLSYATPGVSLRMQRAALPFIIALVLLIISKRKGKKLIRNENLRIITFGFLAGSCISWSNDFGISVFLSICYILMILYLHWNLQFVKRAALFLLGTLSGLIVFVSVLTWGNLMNWIDYNFLGVASDQFWYYMQDQNSKLLVLSDIPRNLELICGFGILLYYSYKIRKSNYEIKDVLLLFIFLSTLMAGYAYSLSSMKDGQFAPYYLVFYISVLSFIFHSMKKITKVSVRFVNYSKILTILIVAIVLVPNISKALDELNTTRGIYVKELNGYLSHYGDSLQLLSKYYVKNDEIFSTYASALDVMAGKFQPSGIDYIIHVLGDQYRKKYLESFNATDPKYVTTIREDFTYWEYWAKRENWFFYKEFLENYEPVAVTEYNVLWEKTNKDLTLKAIAKVSSIQQIDGSTWEIKVTTDPIINNGIADISFDYKSMWNTNRWKGLGIRRIVNVSDGWVNEGQGGYNIPNAHENYNIPVRINNGEGTVRITSYPANMTDLQLSNIVVSKLYRDSVDYGTVRTNMLNDKRLEGAFDKNDVLLSSYTDINWDNGVNRENRALLLFDQNLNNVIGLNNSKQIQINGEMYSISYLENMGSQWIHVYLDREVVNPISSFEVK